MNILYGRTDISMAGPGIVMLKTAVAMKGLGYDVSIVSSGGHLHKSFEEEGIRSFIIEELDIKKRGVVSLINAILKIRKIIKDKDIDVIHGHNLTTTMLMYAAGLICGKKIKCYTTVHGVGKEYFFKYAPGKLIAVSKYVQNRLTSQKVPMSKIIVIYNGFINLDETPVSPNCLGERVSNDYIYITSVAMMTGGKGHRRVIDAFSKLVVIHPNVRLILIGDGKERDNLINYVKQLHLDSLVEFKGVSFEVSKLLSKSDLFIHLPDSETFGMVVVEAMAAGLAVVAADVGGIPELIDHGQNGIITSHDTDEVVQKLEYLINEDVLRFKMGLAAREKVKAEFSCEAIYSKYSSLYK